MEKKKCLWKRRSSSDKSTGESESSGSMSSQSENCSEDQECAKGSPCHSIQSPEVTSEEPSDEFEKEMNSTTDNSLLKKFPKADQEDFPESNSVEEVSISDGSPNNGGQPEEAAASNAKDENESVNLLKEKLSAALINVSFKDELVKQHAKVAEEAVAGWEKAEDEVVSLKQQLDAAVQQNSNLDEALKECVRQLRLSKEEHERKVSEALAEKNKEYEVSKSKLENQILELQARASSPVLPDPGILMKLEFLERENQTLKNELISQSEELEVRTIERDLSTKAAEVASKHHLESIKIVAKLESECRKLKALSLKSPVLNKGQNQKSPSSSSYSVDSVTNSQADDQVLNSLEVDQRKMYGSESSETSEAARSDSWATALMAELDQFKHDRSLGRSVPSSSVKIDLMDDFLEMERLAAMPDNGHPQQDYHTKLESPKHPSKSVETRLREELKVITCRAGELEEKVRKLEAEKTEVEMTSAQNQMCLENLQVDLIENKMKLEELEAELQEANELKMEFESYANDLKLESQAMVSKIESLQAEIDRLRVSSEKLSSRCQELENDLHRKNEELELQRDAASNRELGEKEKALAKSQKRLDGRQIEIAEAMMKLEMRNEESRIELDEKEIALSESRKCLDEMQIRLKETEMKLEKQYAAYDGELKEKKTALAQSQQHLDELQTQLKEASMKLEELQKELDGANASKERLLSELASAKEEVETMSAQIGSLRTQIDKEQAISAELSAKCEELKMEVKQKEHELELQQNVSAQRKLNQEGLASASGKLVECQKTIASLGSQLKSLATLEDFLIDTARIPGFSGSAPLITKGNSEMWKLHLNNVYLPQKKCDDRLRDPQEGLRTFSKYTDGDVIESSSPAVCNYSSSSGNGFEKLFPMRRS